MTLLEWLGIGLAAAFMVAACWALRNLERAEYEALERQRRDELKKCYDRFLREGRSIPRLTEEDIIDRATRK